MTLLDDINEMPEKIIVDVGRKPDMTHLELFHVLHKATIIWYGWGYNFDEVVAIAKEAMLEAHGYFWIAD